jgi:hypothetical protein
MQDLNAQLLQQVREQWPEEKLSAVRITRFRVPESAGTVRAAISIEWLRRPNDTHIRSAGTGITLYRAAANYLVGTLELKDKPPANVILEFS